LSNLHKTDQQSPKQTIQLAKMQFSVVSIVAALAAVSSAQYIAPNGTAVYPTGTGSPSGTGVAPTASVPFTGAAAMPTGAGSAMAVLAVGAAALVSLLHI
jgi:hypothetical protein